MKSLILGTIAAVALTTVGQARTIEERHVTRPVTAKRTVQRSTVATPVTTRNVVRYGGSRVYYGGGGYYGGYYPYSYGGSSISIGLGGGYGYPGYYGYGYGYPYGYSSYPYGYAGYPYAYNYGYGNGYPVTGYTTTRTVTTRNRDLAYDDNLVVAVQQRLAQAGYYHGAIDAVAGPATRSAIARWEADHGMSADGRIDQETLRAMGIRYS